MTSNKSEFIHIIKERGFLHQCTDIDGLAKVMDEDSITAYIGFDCTAPSLHVGSLMQIMILRWLQKCGHKPIVLMGGGTTKIGDPSGKDESRKLLTDMNIIGNLESIKDVFGNFIQFGGTAKNNALFLNNADWLDNLNYIEFLRDYGKHFSVNRMLSMDSVKLRLEREQNLSFLEFNYMILQAYDFVKLNEEYECRLQIGGSDQWGNIVNGVELSRKINYIGDAIIGTDQIDSKKLFGLTTPLITTSSGAKMGKTANGAVWLNADMLSPFDYWQFWRNTEDADVGKFLRFFTELPMDEIYKLEILQGSEINEAKKILANEATKLCHGIAAAQQSAETARKTFEEGGADENLKTFFIEKSLLEAGVPVFELFHMAGMKESKGEAKKLIEGGGAKVNDEKVVDAKMSINLFHIKNCGYVKLSSGKKHHLLIKIKE